MRAFGWPRARRRGLATATIAASIAMAASAHAAGPDYGVVPQDGAVPSRAEVEQMEAGGVKDIRLILHWPSIESSRGNYNWNGIDAMVRETTNYGVKPFFFLYGTPKWAAKIDRNKCSKKCYKYAPESGKTRRAFADFAAAAVKRYGPGGDFWEKPGAKSRPAAAPAAPMRSGGLLGIPCEPIPLPGCEEEPAPVEPPGPEPPPDPPPEPGPPPPSPPPPPGEPPCGCTEPHPLRVWQIWNEQNSPKYFSPKYDVESYGKLVKSAGKAIHEVDRGADVVLGGVWGPASASKVVQPVEPFLKELYKIKGIKKAFDSIALHPYAANTGSSLAQLKVARRVVKKQGDAKVGTWITEIGWAADGPTTNPYVKGMDGQAKLLRKTLGKYEQKKGLHIRGVFWYSWRDLPGGDLICEWCGYAGLRNLDGSAKPAWDQFSALARN